MKYDEIDNIWTADLDALSRADRGRIYFDRAKQVVKKALDDPSGHAEAFRAGRLNRTYVTDEIGAGPAVATQNPRIRDLLAAADGQVARMSPVKKDRSRPSPGGGSGQDDDLQAIVDELRRVNEIQAAEIVDLRRKLRDAGWLETDLAEHGRLPW